jgi:tRNA(Ile)-lysidine synthase
MLTARIRQAIRRYGLLRPGDAVVVAVSGGPDSVALLHGLALLARREGWKLQAAHLHHGIRGADADADEDLVRTLSARLGVPLSLRRLDPEHLRGASLEARARRVRYAFLHEVARRTGASRIATGHTRDDQAETVLLRLLRGSGARGLAGIRPRREDGVVRPLILASRAEVIEFLARGGVAFREDATNRDPRFLRNRVRHEVLPLLRALSPRIEERLASLADSLRADADWIETSTARARREGGVAPGSPIHRAWLSALPEAIRRRMVGDALRHGGTPPDRVAGAIVAVLDALSDEGRTRSIPLRGGRIARV